MLYFVKTDELRAELASRKKSGLSIGLVPTMGALHEGHLSLVEAARGCDVVVVSIFVNPLQFNSADDLKKYPRDIEKDMKLLEGKCDILYAPDPEAFYRVKPRLSIYFGELEKILEGKYRPGHFSGVAIVVARLLNILQPDQAFFGLKDLQQFHLVQTLVQDLAIPVELKGCSTVREGSGLAMSSRNELLSATGKQTASAIYEGLQLAEKLIHDTSLNELKAQVRTFYETKEGLELEYFELVDENFEVISAEKKPLRVSACVAAFVEGVRLIDNLYLRSEN